MSLPKTIGLFRLTKDAELKYTQSGSAILKMSVAASEKFGDKETQIFLDATVFGKQAEIISQYAGSKGTQIFLSGKLQTESWDKDGVKQYKTSMVVESFDFVAKAKGEGEQPRGTNAPVQYEPRPTPYNQPSPAVLHEIDISEESIPF